MSDTHEFWHFEYVELKLVKSMTIQSIFFGNHDITFENGFCSITYWVKGDVTDEIAIWDGPLTKDQRKIVYNNGSPRDLYALEFVDLLVSWERNPDVMDLLVPE